MRRYLVAIVLLPLISPLLAAPPAVAVDQTIVVPGFDFPNLSAGVPSGTLDWRQCGSFVPSGNDDPGSDLQIRIIQNDDTTSSIGQYALSLETDVNTAAGVVGYTGTPTSSAVVSSMRVRTNTGPEGAQIAYYYPPVEDPSEFWFGVLQNVSGPGMGWTSLNGGGSDAFTWYPINANTGEAGGSVPGTSTLSAFAATHGGDASGGNGGAYLGWVLGCGSGPVGMDRLVVGAPGNARVFDLERVKITLTRPAAPASTTAGRQVRVSTTYVPETTRVSAAKVVLQARAYGAGGFRQVGMGTIVANDDGSDTPARVNVTPLRRTVYRFYFAGSGSAAPAYSPLRTIEVRTALTLSAPARATAGRDFRVTGRSTPAKPGSTVTLQRKVGARWVRVSSGRVAGNGSYALTARSGSAATWVLRMVGGGGTGNLPGTSPTRRVVIGS